MQGIRWRQVFEIEKEIPVILRNGTTTTISLGEELSNGEAIHKTAEEGHSSRLTEDGRGFYDSTALRRHQAARRVLVGDDHKLWQLQLGFDSEI